jgi:hypothetical protein
MACLCNAVGNRSVGQNPRDEDFFTLQKAHVVVLIDQSLILTCSVFRF